MNAEASTKQDSITPIATSEQLVAAREARGLSMSDVAAKLGMMPRQIAAIEEGRWEALPGQAFIRGAIRAYGKALQVDVAPLLATLGAQASPELRASSSLDSPLPRHGALGFDHGGSGSRIVWILLGVIGVIAIAMYFGRGADLGQVLEPGTQMGRTVDVVPLTPDASSAGADTGVTRGASDSAIGSSPAGADGVAGSAAVNSSAASNGIDMKTTGGSSASTATGMSGGSAAGSGIASPDTSNAAAATTGSAASPPGSGAPGASSSLSGVSSPTPGDASVGGSSPSAGTTSISDAAGETSTTRRSAGAADSSVAGAGSATSAANATSASSTATAPSAPTRADSLVMRFERESWVEVRDATGRVLLLGTQPANSMRELSGEKPYSMTIGNAPFVRVEHEGRNVDLGNVTQKGVARLRVE